MLSPMNRWRMIASGLHCIKPECPDRGELRFRVVATGLFTNAQLSDDVEIPLWVFSTYIVEETSATTDQS